VKGPGSRVIPPAPPAIPHPPRPCRALLSKCINREGRALTTEEGLLPPAARARNKVTEDRRWSAERNLRTRMADLFRARASTSVEGLPEGAGGRLDPQGQSAGCLTSKVSIAAGRKKLRPFYQNRPPGVARQYLQGRPVRINRVVPRTS